MTTVDQPEPAQGPAKLSGNSGRDVAQQRSLADDVFGLPERPTRDECGDPHCPFPHRYPTTETPDA